MHAIPRTALIVTAAVVGLHAGGFFSVVTGIALHEWLKPPETVKEKEKKPAAQKEQEITPEPETVEIPLEQLMAAVMQPVKENPPEAAAPPPEPPAPNPPEEPPGAAGKPVLAKSPAPAAVFAPEGEDEKPLNPATTLEASRDMQAAAEEAPVPGGNPLLPAQTGIGIPEITVSVTEFQAGDDRLPEKIVPSPDSGNPEGSADPAKPLPMDEVPAPLLAEQPNDSPPEEALPPDQPEPVPQPPGAVSPRDLISIGDGKPITLADVPDPSLEKPRDKPPQARRPPPADRLPEKQTAAAPRGTIEPKPAAPSDEQAAFSSFRRKTAIKGGLKISNKGKTSVDARGTPEAKFERSVSSAIETEWRRRMLGLKGYISPGVVEVEFEVDAQGRPHNVRLRESGNANAIMEDCGITAVLHARLPLIPEELRRTLEDSLTRGRFRTTMTFYIY